LTLRMFPLTHQLPDKSYFPGEQLGKAIELSPSPTALANGTCDRLTDATLLTLIPGVFTLHLFSSNLTSQDGDVFSPVLDTFIGSLTFKTGLGELGAMHYCELRDLSVPIYSTDSGRKTYGYLVRSKSGSQKAVNLGSLVMLKVGIES